MLEKSKKSFGTKEAFGALLTDLSKDVWLLQSWTFDCKAAYVGTISSIFEIGSWLFTKANPK